MPAGNLNHVTTVSYTTVPVPGEASRWDCDNADEIRALAGDDFLYVKEDRLWVQTNDGPAEVHPGWWAARETAPHMSVYSGAQFRLHALGGGGDAAPV